jgi:hypothetical protein
MYTRVLYILHFYHAQIPVALWRIDISTRKNSRAEISRKEDSSGILTLTLSWGIGEICKVQQGHLIDLLQIMLLVREP